jgi:predicted Zn-dependent protease
VRDYFYTLADELRARLAPGEIYLAYFAAEESDFVRFNRNRVRQAGRVRQLELQLDLIQGQRHVQAEINLYGDIAQDLPRLAEQLNVLRTQLAVTPEDAYLHYALEPHNTEIVQAIDLPDSTVAVRTITETGDGLDLVGFWASGPIYRGFANSLGQRNWYATASFSFDWSCYDRDDRAVKASYAGTEWSEFALHARMSAARDQLALLRQPPVNLAPGRYRAYLAPAALEEIFGLLSWDAFGLKSHKTCQTPLLKMVQEGRRLHPSLSLGEDLAGGMQPRFTQEGFVVPERIELIAEGMYQDSLANARSAKEFGTAVNALSEAPGSLDLAAGSLPQAGVLDRLDKGIYLNNLWYLNYSDHNEARITGMSRYACFAVEGGRIVAPMDVMRFDDSVYRMFGEGLAALTLEREFIMSTDTYERRSLGSMRLPGAVIEDFALTL